MDPAELRELLATPPPQFVAARNALVKALRGRKDRDAAKAVAAIRRPAWSEWALNATSGSHPDEIAAFAEAAGAVRAAQEAAIEGRPADVRQALRALRDQTSVLVTAANAATRAAGHADETAELQARLSELAGDADAVDELRRGVVGLGEAAAGLLAGQEPASRPSSAAPARRSASASDLLSNATAPAAAPATARPAPAAAERRRLMRQLADAERDLHRSQRAARRAEEDVATAQEAADLAARRLADAQQRLDETNDVVRRDEAARAEAAAALDAAS